MYDKTDGVKYYHFVQSHPSGYKIEPSLAHKIAVEFAERTFPGHEVVVATHTDVDHIHSHFILKEVSIRCAEGARNHGLLNISTDDFFDIDMALPADLEEQRKIAGFLSNIDKVIAQSEAEVRNLERQKKAAMQKIFSQEIRFRHDNGTEYPEWEERELAYCFEERDTKQVPTEEAPLALKN